MWRMGLSAATNPGTNPHEQASPKCESGQHLLRRHRVSGSGRSVERHATKSSQDIRIELRIARPRTRARDSVAISPKSRFEEFLSFSTPCNATYYLENPQKHAECSSLPAIFELLLLGEFSPRSFDVSITSLIALRVLVFNPAIKLGEGSIGARRRKLPSISMTCLKVLFL